jgi:hypothetical protein
MRRRKKSDGDDGFSSCWFFFVSPRRPRPRPRPEKRTETNQIVFLFYESMMSNRIKDYE